MIFQFYATTLSQWLPLDLTSLSFIIGFDGKIWLIYKGMFSALVFLFLLWYH